MELDPKYMWDFQKTTITSADQHQGMQTLATEGDFLHGTLRRSTIIKDDI